MRIMKALRPIVALLMLLIVHAASEARTLPSPTRIRISAVDQQSWRVSYHFKVPVRQLVFVRSPDDSRTRTWKTSAEFELVPAPEGEKAVRRDRAVFTDVSFEVPPVYSVLPKDYAPFSPFGDGGLLFHTGRFFACAEACPANTRWRMELIAQSGRHVLVNGQRKQGYATWLDSDEGRYIYLGEGKVVESPDLLTVIDGALPEAIRNRLIAQLPQFMHYFSRRLGNLPSRPTLFASYDAAYEQGVGRQGGTLPGQIFVHFYGNGWPERMQMADFAGDLAWHFAHEAAHLYQRQRSSDRDAWIHEGSAEALAALAIQAINPEAGDFVRARIERARDKCADSPLGGPLREKMRANASELAYSCGLILNLGIDSAMRSVSPENDGLFTVWRHYILLTPDTEHPGEDAFLAAVASGSTSSVAESLRRALDSADVDVAAPRNHQ
jgi:hypothetical protein